MRCSSYYTFILIILFLLLFAAAPASASQAESLALVVDWDMGDAPDPNYPTLLASNGARHADTGPMLGSVRDKDVDGQPSAMADGDDADGSDDDDGVVFFGPPIPDTLATVEVTVSTSCNLNAWIDFNQDGDWEDVGEQIFTDQLVNSGLNSLTFDTPSDAGVAGTFYSRFRVSTVGGDSYNGFADDGEVEDHLVMATESDPGGGSSGGCGMIDPQSGGGPFTGAMEFTLLALMLLALWATRRRLTVHKI